jgi:hypothetical protein
MIFSLHSFLKQIVINLSFYKNKNRLSIIIEDILMRLFSTAQN